MKNPEQNAKRWLRQAEYDLKQAEKNLFDGSFAYAAFFSEQSAQKSLKAYLIFKGKRFVFTHSVGELMKEAGTMDNSFLPLIDSGKRLDRHYITSRYPDALPEPAIPAESYTKSEAEEAVETAKKVFQLCSSLICV
ncbi:MAG: HEPN domain-containing protein [Candidatus Brocadiales bacterium]